MPKISVVMCCYNAAEHIKESIESILEQTFTDYEFIIWNDGSTDDTETIIKTYNDSRIRYFYHENTGLGIALKLACSETRTEIIARMDADDISVPTRLEKEYNYLASHENTVLVSSSVQYIDDKGNLLGRSFPYTSNYILQKQLYRGNNCLVHPASMFRKIAYIKAGAYENLRKAQDLVLFSRIIKCGDIHNCSAPLLFYRISTNSISSLTLNSPYSPLINEYLRKIVKDPHTSEDDILIYNKLVSLSKQHKNTKLESSNYNNRYHRSIEERLFFILSYIMGQNIAQYIIIFSKNMFGYLNCYLR